MTTSTVQFSNFASTTLVGTYGIGDTALTVSSAASFPTVSVGSNWFYAVITDSLTAPTKREIVKVTNVSGSIFTVTRAQDGSSAQTWANGSYIELRVVNKALQDLFDEAVTDATSTLTSLTSATDINITVDNDNNGSGSFNVLSGPDTVLQVTNSGELIASPGYANIKDFGGDATGASDNAAAFTAAVAAGYKSIYFPRGTYKFLSGVSTTNQSLHIFGDGPQASVLKCSNANSPFTGFTFLTFTGTYDQFDSDQLIVEKVSIQTDCASGTAQGSAIKAIMNATSTTWKEPFSSVIIDKVEIGALVDSACFAKGIELDTCQMVKITDTFINGFMTIGAGGARSGIGIELYSRWTTNNNVKGTDINIENCVIYQCTDGVRVNHNASSSSNFVEGVHIDACTILNCNNGVKIGDTSTAGADGLPGWFIQGNHITATDNAIDIQTMSQFIIENNLIYATGGTTFAGVKVVSAVTAGLQMNGLISDNTIMMPGSYTGNTYGIKFEGADATPGTLSIRVSNNAFENFTYAIITDANTTGVHITPDNRVISGGTYSIAGSNNIASGFNQDVGIGRTPQARLDVYDATGDSVISSESGSGAGILSLKSSGTNSTYQLFYNATGERFRLSAGNAGELVFYSGAGVTQRAIIDSNGNLGVGQTPPTSADGNLKGTFAGYFGSTASNNASVSNAYWSSIGAGTWRYIGTGRATAFTHGSGAFIFYGSASGASAGDAITFNPYFTITDDGRLHGSSIHNSSGAVTGTTNQYIASGTYTPTLTNTTNIASSQNSVAQWIRVGNVVTVSGKVEIDPTAAGIITLKISLPIASAFTLDNQLAGTAINTNPSIATEGAGIAADTAADVASLSANAVNTGNNAWMFHFTYVVV